MLNFMQMRGKNPEQAKLKLKASQGCDTDKKKKTVDSAGVLQYLYTYGSNTSNSKKYFIFID